MMLQKNWQANVLLLLTAVIWGGGFVAQRLGVQQIGPYTFNGIRFLIGSAVLIPIILTRKAKIDKDVDDWRRTLLTGSAAGLFLFFGATFQQLGLIFTTAGKAGFITGLYVVIVPILGVIWGERTGLTSWLGAVLAVVGLYFLSAAQGLMIAPGDGYVLIGALFWAGHVQFLSHFSPRVDALLLSVVQYLITALISLAIGMAIEPFDLIQVRKAAWPILYAGVFSTGIAYTLQVIGQQRAKPARAAIILSLESVFAALWGWVFLREVLSGRAVLGSALMLAGMILSQHSTRASSLSLWESKGMLGRKNQDSSG